MKATNPSLNSSSTSITSATERKRPGPYYYAEPSIDMIDHFLSPTVRLPDETEQALVPIMMPPSTTGGLGFIRGEENAFGAKRFGSTTSSLASRDSRAENGRNETEESRYMPFSRRPCDVNRHQEYVSRTKKEFTMKLREDADRASASNGSRQSMNGSTVKQNKKKISYTC